MRWLFKAIMIVVVMLGLSSYAGYLMTGRLPWSHLPRLTKPDLKLPALPELPELSASPGGGEVLPVYKWRNEEGVWHYTTDLPPEGVDYQIIDLDPGANSVEGWSDMHRRAAARREADAGQTQPSRPTGEKDPALYSPSGVKKLFDDAREVRDRLEQRGQEQQEALDGL